MRIFTIEDDKLKINENCFLIPELKAVIEEFEDPIPAFTYIDGMTWPESPYANLEDSERQEMVSADAGGDFELDDPIIESAVEKCKKLYETPIQSYYEGQKNSMWVMGKMLKNLTEASLTFGKDGNGDTIFRMQKEAGKVMDQFLKLEKLWKEQLGQKMRGSSEMGLY